MKKITTIRNCPPEFLFVCSRRWEELAPTGDERVRHCGHCDQDVYFCESDQETIAHARAGPCIARERPDGSELPQLILGRATPTQATTPGQAAAEALQDRESGIDDAIHSAPSSTRHCPKFLYPAPNWRVACRVSGFEFGRVRLDEGSTP